MSIRQTITHEFYMDVMNVMYFDYDKSIYVNDSEDNSVQIHGVEPEHFILTLRNILCCNDALDISALKEHQKNTLFEIYAAINRARENGELGACGTSTKSVMKGE